MPVTRNTPRSGGLPLINPRERVDPRVRDAVNAYVRLYYPRILTELGAMSCSAGHALVVGYKPGISGTFYYRVGLLVSDYPPCMANDAPKCRGKAGAKCTEGVRPLSFQLPERDRAALMSQVQPIFDDGEPEAGLDTLREECDAIRKERRSWRRDRLGERCFTLETRVANFIRERRALVLTRSDCRAIMWAAEAEYLSVRGEDDEAEVNFLKQQFLTAYRRYVEVMDSLKYATEEEVMARDDLAHLKKVCIPHGARPFHAYFQQVFTHLDLQRPAIPGFQPYEGPSLGPSGGLRTFATDMVQLTVRIPKAAAGSVCLQLPL